MCTDINNHNTLCKNICRYFLQNNLFEVYGVLSLIPRHLRETVAIIIILYYRETRYKYFGSRTWNLRSDKALRVNDPARAKRTRIRKSR